MYSSSVLVIIPLWALTISGFQPAGGAVEVGVLDTRAVTAGGWALINPTCADDAQLCSGEFCCPGSLECNHNGYGNHCCPPGTNCLAAYQASPQCADDSWSLWRITKAVTGQGYFCCLPGQIGTNAGTCVSSNTPVVATLSASLLSSATGVASSQSTSATTKTSSKSAAISTTTSAAASTSSPVAAGSSSSTSTQTVRQTPAAGGANTNKQGILAGVGMFGGVVAALL